MASLIVQLVKNPPAMQEIRFNSWVGKIRWRRDRLPTPVFLGFPGGSAGKESICNVWNLGWIPGFGRSPGEGNATHYNILAWEMPWTEEPSGLQSIESQRVVHAWTHTHTHPIFICLSSWFSLHFILMWINLIYHYECKATIMEPLINENIYIYIQITLTYLKMIFH